MKPGNASLAINGLKQGPDRSNFVPQKIAIDEEV